MQVGVEEGHSCDGEREAALALRALRDEDGILGSAQPPPPAVAGGAGGKPSTGAKQPWSESKRAMHSRACKDKSKLSLGQKLEIVQRATSSADSPHFRTQAQLAQMFGKSRSAVSKILRPDNVEKLRQVAALATDQPQNHVHADAIRARLSGRTCMCIKEKKRDGGIIPCLRLCSRLPRRECIQTSRGILGATPLNSSWSWRNVFTVLSCDRRRQRGCPRAATASVSRLRS